MKRSQFSEHKFVKILNEAEAGASAEDACRRYGVSPSTFYRWKAKFGGIEAADIRRRKKTTPRSSSRWEAVYDFICLQTMISQSFFIMVQFQ